MPQIEAKGAAIILAFMSGVCVGLVDHNWALFFVAVLLAGMSLWLSGSEDRRR